MQNTTHTESELQTTARGVVSNTSAALDVRKNLEGYMKS